METHELLKELLPTRKTTKIGMLTLLLLSVAIALLAFLFEAKSFGSTICFLLISSTVLLLISLLGSLAAVRSLSREVHHLRAQLLEATKDRDIYSAIAAQKELSDIYKN